MGYGEPKAIEVINVLVYIVNPSNIPEYALNPPAFILGRWGDKLILFNLFSLLSVIIHAWGVESKKLYKISVFSDVFFIFMIYYWSPDQKSIFVFKMDFIKINLRNLSQKRNKSMKSYQYFYARIPFNGIVKTGSSRRFSDFRISFAANKAEVLAASINIAGVGIFTQSPAKYRLGTAVFTPGLFLYRPV